MRDYVRNLEIKAIEPQNPNQDLIDRLDALIAKGTYASK